MRTRQPARDELPCVVYNKEESYWQIEVGRPRGVDGVVDDLDVMVNPDGLELVGGHSDARSMGVDYDVVLHADTRAHLDAVVVQRVHDHVALYHVGAFLLSPEEVISFTVRCWRIELGDYLVVVVEQDAGGEGVDDHVVPDDVV